MLLNVLMLHVHAMAFSYSSEKPVIKLVGE